MFNDKRRKGTARKLPRGVSKIFSGVTAVRSKSPVEDFYCEELPSVYGSPACVYRNDIFMVLAQKRLDTMTLEQFQAYLDHNVVSDPLDNLRSKVSDADLLKFVKSRYIQHPAELKAWSAYIESNLSGEVSKANQEIQSRKAASKPQQENATSAPAAAE